MDDNLINLNIPTNSDTIIKVIGVGGGGGNAVTNMYKEGIHNVSFALCNTDQQALNGSDVPVKLLLGRTTTCGLGSGDQPERGRAAAEELSLIHISEPTRPLRVLLLWLLVFPKKWEY